MADILRDIADELEHKEGAHAPENTEKSSDDFQHEVGEVDHKDGSDGTTMVPPLQQKLELLKKAAGEDNAFDAQDSLTHAGEHGLTYYIITQRLTASNKYYHESKRIHY